MHLLALYQFYPGGWNCQRRIFASWSVLRSNFQEEKRKRNAHLFVRMYIGENSFADWTGTSGLSLHIQVDHGGLALEGNAACFSNSAALLCWFWCSAEHIAPNELFTGGQKLNVPWCANTHLAALIWMIRGSAGTPQLHFCSCFCPACTFKVTTQPQMPWEIGYSA